jgi:hypothetical protein
MAWLIVGVAVLWLLIEFLDRKKKKEESKPIVHEIQRTHTLNEMITSVDYGRVYPYYTGMSFTEVKDLFKYFCTNYTKGIQIYETKGVAPLVSIPNNLNPHIDEVILGFNDNHVIDSISIVIRDFEECGAQLKGLMCAKFGTHTPSDGRYITWRNLRMVIRVDEIDGVVEVLYSKCLIF